MPGAGSEKYQIHRADLMKVPGLPRHAVRVSAVGATPAGQRAGRVAVGRAALAAADFVVPSEKKISWRCSHSSPRCRRSSRPR